MKQTWLHGSPAVCSLVNLCDRFHQYTPGTEMIGIKGTLISHPIPVTELPSCQGKSISTSVVGAPGCLALQELCGLVSPLQLYLPAK